MRTYGTEQNRRNLLFTMPIVDTAMIHDFTLSITIVTARVRTLNEVIYSIHFRFFLSVHSTKTFLSCFETLLSAFPLSGLSLEGYLCSIAALHRSLFRLNHSRNRTAWVGVRMSRRSESFFCEENRLRHEVVFLS